MAGTRLLSARSYAAAASDPPADLKPLLREVHPNRMRRNNRFTELALLGALRCVQDIGGLPEQCALYLASGQGNVSDTVSLLHETVRDRLEPMPLSFINVSSNIAGFTVSQVLGLHGHNIAVSRNGGAFDSALELALLDLQSGAVPMALVGVVEEYALPPAEHCRRLGLAEGELPAEQSSWLLLTAESGHGREGPVATCQRYRSPMDLPDNPHARWIAGADLPVSARGKRPATESPGEPLPGYSESIRLHPLVEALDGLTKGRSERPVYYLNGDGTGGLLLFEFNPAHRE
ncbi:MAG: beta-ketoacyl synthase N-terminal-like domain-containing protein [Pseudomonadota bacterium]